MGRIHSIESFGTLDGPGIRTVVFLQGCPLRCKYCHNIDCVPVTGGDEMTPEELVEKVMKYSAYWKDLSEENVSKTLSKTEENIPGGVTFSGGDPILQAQFVKECAKLLKQQQVHVAIDTSLYTTKPVIEMLFPYIDLWMVSTKHMNDIVHKELTTVSNIPILENIKFLDNHLEGQEKLRLRYLLVPTITDSSENLSKLIVFIKELKSIEAIEILLYSRLGRQKWIDLFNHYEFEDIKEPTKEDGEKIMKMFKSCGIEKVIL